MDVNLVVTSGGCIHHFRGRNRRYCLGCTDLCRPRARTAAVLEYRGNPCLLSAAAAVAEVGDRSLVGKRLSVAVGLDGRMMMAWMATTGARTCWSLPAVRAIVGEGEYVEERERERNVDYRKPPTLLGSR